MRVAEILKAKGTEVHTIERRSSVDMAVHRLRLENVGALVVSDDGTSINGVISERDIVRALAVHGREALNFQVADVMTPYVRTCSPESKLQDVMATMTHGRFRHVPVEKDGRLVGLVSIGDIVKHRLGELELESQVLRDRVLGAG